MSPPAYYSVAQKVVLVTGALAPVGRKLSRTLIELGARVVLVDDAGDGSGEALVAELCQLSGRESCCVYIETDLSKLRDIQVMVDAAVLTFGRLDVLVNSAERFTDRMAGEDDAQRICECIDVNMRAPIVATWVFARYLREAGIDGVVVNVAALAGLLPARGRRHEVYGAAAAGLIHFSEALRTHAPRIRVCALAPYYYNDSHASSSLLDLTSSSDQVVASVLRCIEDPRLAGRTLLVAGSSSYSHTTWIANLFSYIQMSFVVLWGLLTLLVRRIKQRERR